MSKRLGQDFADLKKKSREIPEVADYLNSFSVVIGDLVFSRRMQMGLTQQQLAELSGLTQPMVSKVEAGQVVTTDTLNNIFRVLKLHDITPIYDEDAATREVVK
jgi:predicted transcriptional regulator